MDIGGLLAIIITVILLTTGVPILATFALGSLAFILLEKLPALPIGQIPFSGADKFPFLAIPLFVLTGELISKSGIAKQLVDLSYAIIGWLRGGLGMATLGACGFFAAISGSNSATAAAMGSIMMQPLEKVGYQKSHAGALIASGACMGIIIPPSICFIVYGAIASVSVGALFIGGIIPGILMIICMCIANYFLCKKLKADPPLIKFSFKNLLKATWEAKYGLIAPLIILGSIYTGVATPTESAAVAVLYCFIVGMLFGKLKLQDIPKLLLNSAIVCGIVVPIIAIATLFGQMLSLLRIPDWFVGTVLSISSDKFVLLLLMAIILLIAGCVMETTPNMLILTPLLTPIVAKLGIDPVHWGVCFMTTLTVGFVTPPVGLNLYVISSMTGVSIIDLSRRAVPYIVAMGVALIFIYAFPQLTLFLVQFMR
ncbi:MAG: C4-dicarboxylate transporter, DctM subunit [Clostridia bacterium]|nr:C4-dicarboxylate transporter, DctM subunit [Clostridia bacterium]